MARFERVSEAAALAAPYVRKVAGDEELRDDLRDLMRSAGRLYNRIGHDDGLRRILYDDRIRRDIDDVLEAVQHGAKRVIPPPPPRHHYLRWFFIITALVGGAVAALFMYPRGREKIVEPVQRIFKGERQETPSWEQSSGMAA